MSAIEVQKKDDGALIKISGRLDAECVGRNWSAVFQQLQRSAPEKIIIDASALKDLDGAGIAFLLSLQRSQENSQRSFEIVHLNPAFQQLLQDSTLEGLADASAPTSSFRQVAEDLGEAGYSILDDLKRRKNIKLVKRLLDK